MVFGTRNTHGRECGLPLRPPLLCLTTAATTLRPSPPSGMLSQKPTLKLCKSIISFEFAMEREVLTILKGVNKSRRRLTSWFGTISRLASWKTSGENMY
ncbi:uncharacterized protein [Triticum aestivum]|uniref:uncharacterized protein isoform X4 n=1 Tax=Triticum aestivum TaxID=4565 RepID=UPI001D00412E|nr:uncharacterized protein LOC123077087 isoform X4 [Triticum aestivum]XP_044417978.1 uncharacterized protein LOC123143196 isoform X4 [Triticum aestivum]